jgi:hypothetical protein
LAVDRVPDCSTGNGSGYCTNQGARGAVSAAAVVANNGSCDSAKGSTFNGSLLSVWTGSDTSGENGAECEGRAYNSIVHG